MRLMTTSLCVAIISIVQPVHAADLHIRMFSLPSAGLQLRAKTSVSIRCELANSDRIDTEGTVIAALSDANVTSGEFKRAIPNNIFGTADRIAIRLIFFPNVQEQGEPTNTLAGVVLFRGQKADTVIDVVVPDNPPTVNCPSHVKLPNCCPPNKCRVSAGRCMKKRCFCR